MYESNEHISDCDVSAMELFRCTTTIGQWFVHISDLNVKAMKLCEQMYHYAWEVVCADVWMMYSSILWLEMQKYWLLLGGVKENFARKTWMISDKDNKNITLY